MYNTGRKSGSNVKGDKGQNSVKKFLKPTPSAMHIKQTIEMGLEMAKE